jgi:hypothetical protein
MPWDWSRVVELSGLVVTILALHISNVRFAQQTRDELTKSMTEMKTKLDLLYTWFKRTGLKGRSTESDDRN